MIAGFRHRGLKRLFEHGDRRGMNPQHVVKIERILAVLDVAQSIDEVNLQSFRLHALSGDLKGFFGSRTARPGMSTSSTTIEERKLWR
jgi:proteic killer suppression protein